MTYIVICTILLVVVINILEDTHVKVYSKHFGEVLLQDEYDIHIPMVLYYLIVLLGFIPVVNVILYVFFGFLYIKGVIRNESNLNIGYNHVLSIKGERFIPRMIKRIVCKISTMYHRYSIILPKISMRLMNLEIDVK